ncbi:MAG: Glycosyl transferase [Parcubacteria group bacterium Greene0714_36]|nr:MAG: Glycosyl transferase [Parcubacteria group bacterium Greene0714_36]
MGMKIAIIVRRLNVKGGTQKQALFLARTLQRHGHQVTLYSFFADRARSHADLFEGLPVVALGMYPASRNVLLDFWNEYRAARALARRIDRDTDILNPHDQVSYRVAYYFKKDIRNIPSVWMMNDMPTKTWGYWRERECGSRRPASFARRMLWSALDAWDSATAVKAQNRIVVLDNRDREWVRDAFGKDAVVVRSGLDHAQFPYHPRTGLDAGRHPIKILSVGIPFPHRRFEDILVAIRLLRERGVDTSCAIVGDYDSAHPYAKKLSAYAHAAGVAARISFTGRVPDAEFLRHYQESDIFVFPCHLQSWGLAVFEAMACGTAVIVSTTAGASEVLTDGENALLVPPKNPKAIVAAIERLIATPALYESLSRKGRTFVEQNISWERYAKDMLEVLEGAVSGRNRS